MTTTCTTTSSGKQTTTELAAKLWRNVKAQYGTKHPPRDEVTFVVNVVRHQMAELDAPRTKGYDSALAAVTRGHHADPIKKWAMTKSVFVDTHAAVEDILLAACGQDQELPKYLAINDAWFQGKSARLGACPADLSYLSSGRSFA